MAEHVEGLGYRERAERLSSTDAAARPGAPMDERMVRISKMLARALRHDPGRVGLTLDANGWVDVDALLAAFERHGSGFSRAELEYVVEHNDKRRFTIAGERIRAAQGHSIDVDLGLEPLEPPSVLFHGTGADAVASILATGIHAGSRQYVHLSADEGTARKVGARHGRPVVLVVDAAAMADAGTAFFHSANGVWLVDAVPSRYVQPIDP